uniref:isoprenyl transferase n=1 Tax=Herbidospora sakaeratensis TaxID=564415 RepID=UPI000785E347|nr:isoprenyl transferase [Herbidospora sakaeratensis]
MVGMRRRVRGILDRIYVRRLAGRLPRELMPRHIGIMVDGNRRWARSAGLRDPADGHRAGGAKIPTFLRWCDAYGIEQVTIYLLSDDNLGRGEAEVAALLEIIEGVVEELAAPGLRWEVTPIGSLDLLPDATARAIKGAAARTAGRRGGVRVNVAIGYGGQREIADAVRSAIGERLAAGVALEEILDGFDAAVISRHVYTAAQAPLDMIVRTSGEQRLSGFMLWQSAYAEMHFCECYWPDFREIDFLRALRSYAGRGRRFGR